MTSAIVSDPERVSPAWLTETLASALGLERGRVVRFDAEFVGTGQMGRNVRFLLDWQDAPPEAPRSVVGKFPSDDPKSRATGTAQGAYRKEVLFYRELRGTVGIRTPRCYRAEIDAAGSDFVMLLEDLAPARQGDQLAGCSPEAGRLALSELAKLHAPRWSDPTLEQIDALRRGPEGAGLLQAMYKALWPGFAERYATSLEPEALALTQRLGDSLQAWARGEAGPTTLVHGDYRLDNMLFGDPRGRPGGGYPLAVVDWQTVGLGPGASDAAYFLGASLLPDDRRTCERDLVREYHEELRAGGVGGYAWDDCWRDYRRGTFAGVVMAVLASMLVEQTPRGDEMFIAMAARHAAHALDLEAESLL